MNLALKKSGGVGIPTLRLRGDYLAIVTLGFGEIVRIFAGNTDSIGGSRGIAGIPTAAPKTNAHTLYLRVLIPIN